MSGLVNGLIGILFRMCTGTSGSVFVPLCHSQTDKVVLNSCLSSLGWTCWVGSFLEDQLSLWHVALAGIDFLHVAPTGSCNSPSLGLCLT